MANKQEVKEEKQEQPTIQTVQCMLKSVELSTKFSGRASLRLDKQITTTDENGEATTSDFISIGIRKLTEQLPGLNIARTLLLSSSVSDLAKGMILDFIPPQQITIEREFHAKDTLREDGEKYEKDTYTTTIKKADGVKLDLQMLLMLAKG